MIEPIIGERQCRLCNECKPLTCFSPSKTGAGGYQCYCKPCRSNMVNKKARGDRASKKKGAQGDASPTAWIMPAMTTVQAQRCAHFRAAMCAMTVERRSYL